jgi:hypothetical protein
MPDMVNLNIFCDFEEYIVSFDGVGTQALPKFGAINA